MQRIESGLFRGVKGNVSPFNLAEYAYSLSKTTGVSIRFADISGKNGFGACCIQVNHKQRIIVLPRMNYRENFSYSDFRKVKAFLNHECCHIIWPDHSYSFGKKCKSKEDHNKTQFAGIMDDLRIEYHMGRMYNGIREDFKFLIDSIFADIFSETNTDAIEHRGKDADFTETLFGSFYWLCQKEFRKAECRYNDISAQFFPTLEEYFTERIKPLVADFIKTHDSAGPFGEIIYDLLKERYEDILNPPDPPKPDNPDTNNDTNQSPQESDPDESADPGEGSGGNCAGEGSESTDDDGKSCGNSGSTDDADDLTQDDIQDLIDSTDASFDDEDDTDDGTDSLCDDKDSDVSDTDSNDDVKDSSGASKDLNDADTDSDDDDTDSDDDDTYSSDDDMDLDAPDKPLETESSDYDDAAGDLPENDPYRDGMDEVYSKRSPPVNSHDAVKEVADEEYDIMSPLFGETSRWGKAVYAYLRKDLAIDIERCRTIFERVLISERDNREIFTFSGTLAQRRLSQLVVKPSNPRVFKRSITHQDIGFDISILIDMSGSMGALNKGYQVRQYNHIETVSKRALSITDERNTFAAIFPTLFTLVHAFDGVNGVNLEVSGFSADYRPEAKDTSCGFDTVRVEGLNTFYEIKPFACNNTAERMERLCSITETPMIFCENFDLGAIKIAASRLQKYTTMNRKLLIVLSDGSPLASQCKSENITALGVKELEKYVNIFGIGLRSRAVERIYTNHVHVDSLTSNFMPVIFDRLQKFIMHGK